MAPEDSQPGNPPADSRAGRLLRWELTLPGISDRSWRAQAPNLIRWLVTRQEDGRWSVSRYPEPRGMAASFEEANQLAEYLAQQEA